MARGSTRAWRKLRRAVLDRDGWLCQLDAHTGDPLGRQLWTGHPDPRHRASVEHLDPIGLGHPVLASMDRLVASCTHHNAQGGAAMTNASRPTEPERGWSW